MRLYIDNQLLIYLIDYIQDKLGNRNDSEMIIKEVEALIDLAMKNELLVSEEIFYEFKNIPNQTKRKYSILIYKLLKQGKSVIRNSVVLLNDRIGTLDSPDIFLEHNKTDDDLNLVLHFMKKKHPSHKNSDIDSRLIANCMLKENRIDYFLTYDQKSLLDFKKEIEKEFGVKIRKPSELVFV